MREIRLVGLSEDGSALVVEAAGEQLRLPVDSALLEAVAESTRQLPTVPPEPPLTPRQIQARMRAGESAEDVARSAGITIEKVTRFQGPVLEEQAHHVRKALGAGGGGASVPLAARIDAHFAALGLDPTEAEWDSRRREDGTWVLQLHYTFGGRTHEAQWIWEPARARVRPSDGLAHAISGVDPPGDELGAVLRPVHAGREADSLGDVSTGTSPRSTDPAGPASPAAPSNRRAAVPAWADIVSGQRTAPPPPPD